MKKLKITEKDYIKANRKASREEEIARHSRPVGFTRIHESKRSYSRCVRALRNRWEVDDY